MTTEDGRFINGMLLPDSFDVDACKKEILKQAKKAIKAIINHNKDTNKSKLFEDEEDGIYIRFGLKRLRLTGPYLRSLVEFRHPERLFENMRVCLILPDFDYKKANRHDPDVDKNARRWADILQEKHGLTGKEISRICTFIELQRELLEPKDKLAFVNSYDAIMIQQNFFDDVTKFLGSPCFKSGKYPFKINTNSLKFRDTLMKVNSFGNLICESNQMHVQIRFGNTSQTKTDLLENFEDALDKAADFLPGGLFNLQVARMQIGNGLALPIYVDFGTSNDVIVKKKEPKAEPIIDECSTLPDGVLVKVTPTNVKLYC